MDHQLPAVPTPGFHLHIGHRWIATTMRYVHVHRTHVEDAWIAGQHRAAQRTKGLVP
jgi:hypothetical protein